MYATFKLDDGLTFIHVAAHEGESPLAELKAVGEFQAAIRERCDEGPVVTQAEKIGSYRS